jgi:hypothetical protein
MSCAGDNPIDQNLLVGSYNIKRYCVELSGFDRAPPSFCRLCLAVS